MGMAGIGFTLHYGNDNVRVQIPLLGRHSVHTALRAVAVGLLEGMHWPEIVVGLQTHRDELRLLAVTGPHGSTILDDTYNASPASTMAAWNCSMICREGASPCWATCWNLVRPKSIRTG